MDPYLVPTALGHSSDLFCLLLDLLLFLKRDFFPFQIRLLLLFIGQLLALHVLFHTFFRLFSQPSGFSFLN